VLLINEFSTFFLNYRQFMLVFKQHTSLMYKVNALLFFLAFFFSRIVFNSFVAYYVGRAYYLTTKDVGLFGVPLWQFLLGIYLIVLFAVFYVLNLVWFRGILKHVVRSLRSSSQEEREQLNPTAGGKKGYETMKEGPRGGAGARKREAG
jgi:signal transduction histidine kinase